MYKVLVNVYIMYSFIILTRSRIDKNISVLISRSMADPVRESGGWHLVFLKIDA